MKTSENIQDIAKAISIAQSQIKPASKDGENPHFKSKFSTIAAAWDAIRIPVTCNGLSIVQDVTAQDKSSVSIVTLVLHNSGQWIEFGPLCMPVSKQDAQGIGSAISYAKRYALCAALGIVASDDDDDAESSISRSFQNKYTTQHKVEASPISTSTALLLQNLESQIDKKNLPEFYKKMGADLGVSSLQQVNEDNLQRVVQRFEGAIRYQESLKSKVENANN